MEKINHNYRDPQIPALPAGFTEFESGSTASYPSYLFPSPDDHDSRLNRLASGERTAGPSSRPTINANVKPILGRADELYSTDKDSSPDGGTIDPSTTTTDAKTTVPSKRRYQTLQYISPRKALLSIMFGIIALHAIILLDNLLTTAYFTSPFVFTVYCLSVSYKLRSTTSFTRDEALRQPLAAMVSIIAVNLGGRFLIALVKGDGMGQVLQNEDKVLTVLLCWLSVYFSPGDIVYRLLSKLKFPVLLLNGWKRSRDIGAGYLEAKRYAPNSLIVLPIVLCVLSGWGGSLLFPFEGQVRGKMLHNDLRTPSIPFLGVVLCSTITVIGNSFQLFSFYQGTLFNFLFTILEIIVFESGILAALFTKKKTNVQDSDKKSKDTESSVEIEQSDGALRRRLRSARTNQNRL